MKSTVDAVFKLMLGTSLVLGTSAALLFALRGGDAQAAVRGGSGPYRVLIDRSNASNEGFYMMDTRTGKMWDATSNNNWNWKPSPPDFSPNVH